MNVCLASGNIEQPWRQRKIDENKRLGRITQEKPQKKQAGLLLLKLIRTEKILVLMEGKREKSTRGNHWGKQIPTVKQSKI